MKQYINIEVLNNDAMAMLQGMERLHLIEMHCPPPPKINWQQKYEGAMTKRTAAFEQITDSLNAINMSEPLSDEFDNIMAERMHFNEITL